jgi:hypothetical protein
VIIALLVLFASTGFSAPVAAPTPICWELHTALIDVSRTDGEACDEREAILNHLGAKGWELVAAASWPRTHTHVLYFKRHIPCATPTPPRRVRR